MKFTRQISLVCLRLACTIRSVVFGLIGQLRFSRFQSKLFLLHLLAGIEQINQTKQSFRTILPSVKETCDDYGTIDEEILGRAIPIRCVVRTVGFLTVIYGHIVRMFSRLVTNRHLYWVLDVSAKGM